MGYVRQATGWRVRGWALSLGMSVLAAAGGCESSLVDADLGGDSAGGLGGDVGIGGDPGFVDTSVAAGVSRFRRLTHAQWDKTVSDLLGLGPAQDLVATFRADPTQGGYLFEGNGDALEVDQALWLSYQLAAAELAEAFVSDEANLAPFLPAQADGMSDAEKADAFIESFGLGAHRRPLTDALISDYRELYVAGLDSFAEHPGFLGGIRLLVEAFLQSPYFLYRVEESSRVEAGRVVLDGYERASRLSYFLWGRMPDAKLFEAAASGELATAAGVRKHAQRMVADARTKDVFEHFFERLLDVERYQTIAPSTNLFPDAPADLSELAAEETRQFIEHVMFEAGGSLRDFLTSQTTYVNAELADIYGLDGSFDVEFQETRLDDTERRGVLTQIGFLASHATSRDPDPIHRGVFVAKRIGCMSIAAPPDSVPPLPDNPEGKSNRQLVEEHTQAEGTTCRNCHATVINPFGFAFENYDALGAYRDMDGEHEVDASSEVPLDGASVAIDDAVDLADALASSEDVHECFSGHLVSFALGRPGDESDAEMIEALGRKSLLDAVSFADLMVEMSVAVSFLNRSAQEEE